MTGRSPQKQKHWAERGKGGASRHSKKTVYCWALRPIGGERFDSSRGIISFFFGKWLMLQEGIVGAQSEFVLTQDVFECCGKYSTDTFKNALFLTQFSKGSMETHNVTLL